MFRRQVSVLSLVALLACATPAAAAEITFRSDVFDLGSTFELSIFVSDAPDLYSYEFEVLFDPNVLRFQSAVNGTLLPDDSFLSVFDFDDPFANLIDIGNSLEGLVHALSWMMASCRAHVPGAGHRSREHPDSAL